MRWLEEWAERGGGADASSADEECGGENHHGTGETEDSVLQDSRDGSRPILQ